MSLFSPFYPHEAGPEGKPVGRTANEAAGQAVEEELASLRAEVEKLRTQLGKTSK
jgi:hypothetical protein